MTQPIGPYTPVVRSGDLVFISGQLGIDENSQLVPGGVTAQTERAMENLRARLDEAGASVTDLVKTTCFLTDMENFSAFNDAYLEGLGDHRPARSTIAVAGLPLGAVVEVEAIAHIVK